MSSARPATMKSFNVPIGWSKVRLTGKSAKAPMPTAGTE
jgi:hypothetical protein